MTTFPTNPAASLKAWEIGNDLEHTELGNSLQAIAIRHGIQERKITDTIKMIHDQYKDNPDGIRRIVGDQIMDKIIHLYKMIA